MNQQKNLYYKGIEICPIRIPKNCKNSIKCELISDTWFFFRKTKLLYQVYEASSGLLIAVSADKDKIVRAIQDRIDEVRNISEDKKRTDMEEES